MTIFLAGATGALGKRLLPRLVADGHRVVATTRVPAKMEALRAAGAEPVIMDALDRSSVMQAVTAASPDVIVHQMTALATLRSLKRFEKEFAETNRLRREGTEHLLAAARLVGARRFIAQGYTGWPNPRHGGRVKTEDDGLDPTPPAQARQTLETLQWLEATVGGAPDLTGIVLRYASFYGPGTSIAADGDITALVRARKLPVVGNGAGVWSFIHVDDAAEVTRLAITGGARGVYNVADDDPAEVSVWLPELARAVGAPPPRHVPAWLARFAIGDLGVLMMTKIRGASNAKAKRTFNWQPAYATWRDGFRRGLA